MADLFGHIFDITTGSYIPKPDPRSYRTVLDSLDADAAHCVLVEDLSQNLPPAKALGMTTVLVGTTEPSEGADYAIGRLEDLVDILPDLER